MRGQGSGPEAGDRAVWSSSPVGGWKQSPGQEGLCRDSSGDATALFSCQMEGMGSISQKNRGSFFRSCGYKITSLRVK